MFFQLRKKYLAKKKIQYQGSVSSVSTGNLILDTIPDMLETIVICS